MTDRIHVLKTHPQYLADVISGSKNFEVRRDDRGFAIGDTLELVEWPIPDAHCRHLNCRVDDSKRRRFSVRVSYILRGGEWGIEPGYVVLGFTR